MSKTLSDFALGCIALTVVAIACVALLSAQTLLLLAGFGSASVLALFLWSRQARLAQACAVLVMLALMGGYVLPKVLEAMRVLIDKQTRAASVRLAAPAGAIAGCAKASLPCSGLVSPWLVEKA